MEKPRRAPSVLKSISQVTENDIRVKLFGTVAEKAEGSILLKDDTGEIRIDTDQSFEEGTKLSVMGRPVKTEKGLELNPEIISRIPGINEKLYKSVLSLSSKI